MKIIKYFFQAIIIYTFFIIIKIIGISLSRKIFSSIFKIMGSALRSEVITNDNIEQALNVDFEKRKKIINEMWSNYGKTFVEYLYLNNFKANNSHITIKGKNILDKIKNEKKKVIFVSGHFANFELMSMEITKAGLNLATIYRPLNNFFLNPFMEYIRKKNVCINQIKKGVSGIRKAIIFLKDGHSIALMIDQRVSEGKRLPFFNRNALTTTIPAQIALKYKYDIVPIYIVRKKNNEFEMEVYTPINVSNLDNSEKNKIDISLKLNNIIEEMIRKEPGQWIWTHNRWK
jgi:Kdo2-lipid IVA lauroyltransferase/acyltransferase